MHEHDGAICDEIKHIVDDIVFRCSSRQSLGPITGIYRPSDCGQPQLRSLLLYILVCLSEGRAEILWCASRGVLNDRCCHLKFISHIVFVSRIILIWKQWKDREMRMSPGMISYFVSILFLLFHQFHLI